MIKQKFERYNIHGDLVSYRKGIASIAVDICQFGYEMQEQLIEMVRYFFDYIAVDGILLTRIVHLPELKILMRLGFWNAAGELIELLENEHFARFVIYGFPIERARRYINENKQ